jgi:hypothetical protein
MENGAKGGSMTRSNHDLAERTKTGEPSIPWHLEWGVGDHKQRLNRRESGSGCVTLQRFDDAVPELAGEFFLDDKSGG